MNNSTFVSLCVICFVAGIAVATYISKLRPPQQAVQAEEYGPLILETPYTVFVCPYGDDMNPGTSRAPVKTLAKAAELSQTGGAMFLCGGSVWIGEVVDFRHRYMLETTYVKDDYGRPHYAPINMVTDLRHYASFGGADACNDRGEVIQTSGMQCRGFTDRDMPEWRMR